MQLEQLYKVEEKEDLWQRSRSPIWHHTRPPRSADLLIIRDSVADLDKKITVEDLLETTATASQGDLADTAVQPDDLVPYARRTTQPASANAEGTVGEYFVDATHAYFCIATNTWVRADVSTWGA